MTTTDRLAPATRFCEALEQVGGRGHVVTDVALACERVGELAAGKPVVVDDDPLVRDSSSGLRIVEDPWQAEVGVTTAVAACARTATLGLAFDRQHPRSTSLVPPCHIAVLPTSRLVNGYGDLVERMAGLSPAPSGMQFITGPSGSADIEMIHIRGMHGPTTVHVVLVADR